MRLADVAEALADGLHERFAEGGDSTSNKNLLRGVDDGPGSDGRPEPPAALADDADGGRILLFEGNADLAAGETAVFGEQGGKFRIGLGRGQFRGKFFDRGPGR